jgi:hypothetical protein
MSATAPRDNHAVESRLKVGSAGKYHTPDTGPSATSSARSLSMMHQAFGGLLPNSKRSHSSNDQERSEVEHPVVASRSDRAPNSFTEERYSYDSVRESENVELAHEFKNRRVDGVASTEFFDYLIAIGGV